MRKTQIYKYYAFGYNYALLKNGGCLGWAKELAISTLKDLFIDLTMLDLKVTLKAAEKLQSILQEIEKSDAATIDAALANRIKSEVERIDPSLDAELQLQDAYVLTEKRYGTDKLLENPDSLLSGGVYSKLSDTSKKDFSLACTQIAFSQPTAAAFHLMRALEEQVKMIYLGFKKTKRLKKPMWGPMIEELRKKKKPKPSEKLMSHLDGIRVHFRNPTQHPEAFYTLDEAQDLLNQTITAVNMIHRELPKTG
ncbi:MAG: hypothetical protein CMD96_03555 [Gammaproteobacteria bacterium]|jgi:hypothetical protein|nr:hypothetical protein [Gammaproteobacteria bacterium]HJP19612.1 hypothetical protein [Nitrospinota bacterium]|tara:strand:+ start:3372 stop:4127 length:756 start_codon:yes stop_codon:yes gene_type:complete